MNFKVALLFSFLPFSVFAQLPQLINHAAAFNPGIFKDGAGSSLFPSNMAIEGSPLFPDHFVNATFTLADNKTQSNIKATINFLGNSLIYEDENGNMMSAVSPVNKVEFIDSSEKFLFEKGLFTAPLLNPNQFYQVLVQGKLTLLKEIIVSYRDETVFENGSRKRVFNKRYNYIVLKSFTASRLSKKMDSFLNSEIVDNKLKNLELYVRNNNLSIKNESDLIKMVNYYNSNQ